MLESIVSAKNLSKRFGSKSVLNDVSVTAEPGDVIGVLGKNGAGKTTLIEVLLGFSPPSSGSARLFGQDSMRLGESIKSRIGFVPQQDELIEMLVGAQQLRVASSFYKNWDHALASRLAAEWEVPLNRRIQIMSVGERQKLSLLLALGHHPRLLVLDEPMASLDPIARRQFLRQIADVSTDTGRTVLFSSHIVSDLERAANKIWIIKDGSLVWHGEVDTLKESVVRLHIRARHALPMTLAIPDMFSSRVDGARATVCLMQWDPVQRENLAERLNANVEVEPLGLEDIFLEMHS
jgi:ABC-2 type transport system ATP-binding protein